jgi:hypothetical protein
MHRVQVTHRRWNSINNIWFKCKFIFLSFGRNITMLWEQVPLSLFLFYIRVGSHKNPGIIVSWTAIPQSTYSTHCWKGYSIAYNKCQGFNSFWQNIFTLCRESQWYNVNSSTIEVSPNVFSWTMCPLDDVSLVLCRCRKASAWWYEKTACRRAPSLFNYRLWCLVDENTERRQKMRQVAVSSCSGTCYSLCFGM